MFKRNLTLALIGALLLYAGAAPAALAKPREEKAVAAAAKFKAEIARLGTGPDARIELKLRDKTKLKGYVIRIGDDSFAVADSKTGLTADIPYQDVDKAKGHNLSTGAKIAIGIAIGVGATFAFLFLLYAIYGND